MNQLSDQLQIIRKKMQNADLPELTITSFEKYYQQLASGHTGLIKECDIQPVDDLPSSEDLSHYNQIGKKCLGETVVIKLNGGLGTSMGMTKAKSLIEVKNGLSFLDIIARQVIKMRQEFDAEIPLLLMNSPNTSADSLKALEKYPELKLGDLPLEFLQNRVPKIQQESLLPVEYKEDPSMEWNPPGHGDIYNSLVISGSLQKLLEKGYKYAFVSNSDNLGAELDTAILGYFAYNTYSFMMEVARRTPADRKGGHLAKQKDGRFLLREVAQCADEDLQYFQDISKHQFFNTNTIWLNLEILDQILKENNSFLRLPLIRNKKTVNPRKPDSCKVFQLETAMGAAISCFDHATAICVPRTRFVPVKTTNDLISLWSDAYVLFDDCHVQLHPDRDKGVLSLLDTKYYKLINDLTARFPYGPPSLINCSQWSVEGDVLFSENIRIEGKTTIKNTTTDQKIIPDNSVLAGDISF